MAASDWVEIYSNYSAEELDAEITALKKQKTLFSSQTVGSKSYTKDLALLEKQMQAAFRVKKIRNAPPDHFTGYADFSGGCAS